MNLKTPRPTLIELEPAEIALPEPLIEETDNQPPQLAPLAPPRRSRLLGFTLAIAGLLLTSLISVFLYNQVTALFAINPLIAQGLSALLTLFTLLLLLLAFREWRAFSRLSRIEKIRQSLSVTVPGDERATVLGPTKQLTGLYRGRADMVWPLERFHDQIADQLDQASILTLAEAELMLPLDRLALAEVHKASRQVAMATALVPLALADVAVALFANLRMIRRIAEIYGGRAGTFGSIRLLRAVFVHLAATGMVAIGDDVISSLAGGGLVSKVSRRFGEGVVNGAMTARIGITAMELCRPMPFAIAARPKVRVVLATALKGVFAKT